MDGKSGGRLVSLDTLRGFDMLFIMGFGGLAGALCNVFGLGGDCWLMRQLEHVPWDGLAFEDTIFPLFLFIAGVSWPFSCAKQRERGDGTGRIALRCLKRGTVLFLLGIVYTGFLGDFSKYRLTSVLGRIGVAWMVSAWLYLLFSFRARLAIAVAILAGYWAFSVSVGAPDNPGASPLSPEGCFTGWIDRTFLPGVVAGPPSVRMDNQSTLGIFPAIVTAMLGVFAGECVRPASRSGAAKTLAMLGVAVVLLAAGLAVAFGFGRYSMPINKRLWSTSFVLVVGAYSFAMFALFYWLIDVSGIWRHTLFFRVIGMNSITIYLAQFFIPFSTISNKLFGGLAAVMSPAWGRVLLAAGYIAVCWLFLFFLYRKKVFLRV